MLSPRYTHGPIVKTGPTAGQKEAERKAELGDAKEVMSSQLDNFIVV